MSGVVKSKYITKSMAPAVIQIRGNVATAALNL